MSAAERVLTLADMALLDRTRALCGAGIVRDREWWEIESARLGSDWAGIWVLRTRIIEELTARAMERACA